MSETFIGQCLPHNAEVVTTYEDWSINPHNGAGHIVMWRNGKRPTAPIVEAPQIVEPAQIVAPIVEPEPIQAPAIIIDPKPDNSPIIQEAIDSFVEDNKLVRQSMAGINNIVFEREEQVTQMGCAMMAQHSMIVYGTRGTAKSKMIRSMSQAFDRSFWTTTISAFTSLDDLFGTYDLIRMHNEGVWERSAKGMLTHDIIFLDEIGNSSAPIRDAIKTAINERVYMNGDLEIPLPLQTLFAASNTRLIDTDATEDAFADRFLIRSVVYDMQNDDNIVKMLMQRFGEPLVERLPGSVITRMQNRIRQVQMTESFMRSAQALRKQIVSDPASGVEHDISHRRLNQTMDLVAAHALLSGRMKANRSDLIVFGWTMWSDPENEYQPLQNWLKANLQTMIGLLETYRSNAEQYYNGWLQQSTDTTIALSAAERMQLAMNTRPKLQMVKQMLDSVRPKLEDQDETDYANALDADLKNWDDAMKNDFYGQAPKVENAEAIILESLKKA